MHVCMLTCTSDYEHMHGLGQNQVCGYFKHPDATQTAVVSKPAFLLF
jgi:hypothetical protein